MFHALLRGSRRRTANPVVGRPFRFAPAVHSLEQREVPAGMRPAFAFGPGRLDNPCDSYHFWSLHSGGANFAFGDGSVKFLRHSAVDILPALASGRGGEVVSVPE